MSFGTRATPKQNRVTTIPAPTGGINARDSLANMPETDALVLNNWWPEPQGCRVRRGSRQWTGGLPGVNGGNLYVWTSPHGDKMFTLREYLDDDSGEYRSAIYDVSLKTDPLAPPPVPVFINFSDYAPRSLLMVNDAGAHLFFNAGGDTELAVRQLVYNESGFHEILFDAGPEPSTPVDYTWYDGPGAQMWQMTSHQGRLWGIGPGSSVAWYLPVDAIYGQWTAFDIGPQLTLGGNLHSVTTWTIDDGNGAEDHLVFVSSKGQAVVYGGTDPSDVATWQLVGVYTIGEPVGQSDKSFVKVGGDLIVLTQRGLVSMAALLVSTKVNSAVNAVNSEKVQPLISAAVAYEPLDYSWQLYYHPAENLFMVNMPPRPTGVVGTLGNAVSGSRVQRQLAANLVVNPVPWTAFSGIPATNWATFNNKPYFATLDGRVYEAWTGWQDEVDLNGENGKDVKTQVQQAYTYFGDPATQKQVGMYRPGFLVLEEIRFGAAVEYDFLVRRIRLPSAGLALETYGLWADKAAPNPLDGIWDQTPWAGGVFPYRQWIQAEGIGTAASLRMSMASKSDILWVATDYTLKGGGVL